MKKFYESPSAEIEMFAIDSVTTDETSWQGGWEGGLIEGEY